MLTSVETEHGPETADAYVCALGPYAPILLRAVGIRLPIYPIKGYSITLPVTDDAAAPQSTLMDETHKVAITRLGERIRVAGQAEIIGYNAKLGPTGTDTVRYVVSDLFPKGGDLEPGRGMDRPAPDDAGRDAGDRADPIREPVPQYRARHAGVDHGLRLGTRGGRRGARQNA